MSQTSDALARFAQAFDTILGLFSANADDSAKLEAANQEIEQMKAAISAEDASNAQTLDVLTGKLKEIAEKALAAPSV